MNEQVIEIEGLYMEVNINKQDVGAEKPSLFGMITSPGLQFERMKTRKLGACSS